MAADLQWRRTAAEMVIAVIGAGAAGEIHEWP